MTNKEYSLCEAVADIAYIAGTKKYYGGDSRADISEFIRLAQKFEQENSSVEWGITPDKDYIDEIYKFTVNNLRL